MCGTVNDTTIEVPWTYTFKGAPSSGWIPAGGMFEGGINLSELGLEGCFTGFLAETRSSPEITAILKDFAFGSFEACDTELTTTPADGAGEELVDGDDADTLPETTIGTGAAGVDVTDVAELEVKGTDTWEGTLDFYLCGPIATGTCETPEGDPPVGVLIDSQDVSNLDETTTYTSASANITEVGRYCWRGEFLSGTSGVPDATDASEGECFEVLPVTPALSTQAVGPLSTPVSGPVPFGDPLYDQATLAGTAHQPGIDGDGDVNGDYVSINATMDTPADGTITFELRGPDGLTLDCTTVATGTGDNPEDVTVNGDGEYFSSGFIPDQPGDYHWVASYDGDSPNTNGTTHNTDCLDDDEDVTVQQLQPTLSTAQTFIPNDAATVSVAGGAGDLDGDVTFYLWIDDPTCGDDDPLTADQSFGPIPVFAEDDGSDPLTDTAATNNAVAYGDDGTDFYWMVVFESTTGSHLDVVGTCGNENSSITIDNGVTEPASP
jgi:hypothetical protein